jgi:hypothetical protein
MVSLVKLQLLEYNIGASCCVRHIILEIPSTQLRYIMLYCTFIYTLPHVSVVEDIFRLFVHSLLLAADLYTGQCLHVYSC